MTSSKHNIPNHHAVQVAELYVGARERGRGNRNLTADSSALLNLAWVAGYWEGLSGSER
ncbi:hypothetical protein RSAG8_06446, partial [Rhizoctonia solani AG-8 WAC10335]